MYITATGMVCAVGLNAASACAAMRASIANFVELPYRDNQGEPIIGASVPGVPFSLKRGERLVELLSMAIADCLKSMPVEPLDRVPLLVGLAEPGRPSGGAELVASSIIGKLQAKLGAQFHPKHSRVITKGHTAGFDAVSLAGELLKSTGVASCLVCGVDSYINATSLLWLDQHWRLKTEQNSDGVIPGEGAAAVLVQRQVKTQDGAHVRLVGMGFAHENAGVLSEEPLLGIGLAEATKSALSESGLQMHEIDFRSSDVTGESYGFKEQSLALGRVMRQRREMLPLWHAVDSIADTGAASGVVQLVRMAHAFQKHYAPGKRAICYASAVYGDRAVVVVQHQAEL